MQAGRLELVSDPVLRERLAQWPAFHNELVDDQLFSRTLVLDRIVPYLAGQGLDLSGALVAGTMPSGVGAETWPVGVQRIDDDATAVMRLLRDPAFKSLVQIRYAYWYHAGGEYRNTLAAAEEIVALVERALAS